MAVLVTGAAGYVAGAVVEALATAGEQVVALVRRPVTDPASLGLPPGVEVVAADICDTDQLAAAGVDRGFDGVCHLAALTRVRGSRTDPLAYFGVNVEGTRRLLEALVRGAQRTGRPTKVVLASTCAVYGEPARQPVAETEPAVPTTPYGATKLAAEQVLAAVAATGVLGAVALRSFNVAGAAGRHGDPDLTRLIPRAVAVAAGLAPALPVNGDGTVAREYLHVADAADAYALALKAARPGRSTIYNIGSGHPATIAEVVATVEEITGRRLARQRQPAADEPALLVADSSRIRAELGWSSPRSTLRRIVADAWQWQLDSAATTPCPR